MTARRRSRDDFLKTHARIGRAGLPDGRADSATTSQLVAELIAAIGRRDDEIARLEAYVAGIAAPGPEAVKDHGDARGSAAIDTPAALPFTRRSDPSVSLIALRARNEAISNAWKPGVAEVGSAARSWRDAGSAAHLTQPRDGDGRWTATGASSFTTGSDIDASSSARASPTSGYEPIIGLSSSGRGGDPDQIGSEQRTTTSAGSSIGSRFSGKFQIAYPDGWQVCHEKCLEETDHIRGSGRPAIYRKCVRKCLGPDADY